jgi:hypothetical protein
MKGLLNFKPIQESIIFHATPNEYGQFLLLSKRIIKYQEVILVLKHDLLFVKKKHPYHLNFAKFQTDTICLEAVKLKGTTLQYVRRQTEQICIEAVRNHAYALRFVENQTEQICIEAVRKDPWVLKFVKIVTDKIEKEAKESYEGSPKL